MRLLIDFFGVSRLSSPSLGCCGDRPERDEREVLLPRRGEEADWRRANEDDGLRAEVGVGGASDDVGDGRAALLALRSWPVRDMRFIVLLLIPSNGSVLLVAWEAADGERADADDSGGMSMVEVSRSRRDQSQSQEERFSQNVCAWFWMLRGGGDSVWQNRVTSRRTQGLSGFRDSQSRPHHRLRANQMTQSTTSSN